MFTFSSTFCSRLANHCYLGFISTKRTINGTHLPSSRNHQLYTRSDVCSATHVCLHTRCTLCRLNFLVVRRDRNKTMIFFQLNVYYLILCTYVIWLPIIFEKTSRCTMIKNPIWFITNHELYCGVNVYPRFKKKKKCLEISSRDIALVV